MVEFLPKESPDEWNTRHVEDLCIHAGLIYIQKQKQKKPKNQSERKSHDVICCQEHVIMLISSGGWAANQRRGN
jgi:hypothetical protein